MATRPELHRAVAKTKSKASEYNDNFDMMMDYCEAVSTEAKNYVDETLAGNVYCRNIGEIVTSSIPLTDAGLHLLDGALIYKASYTGFVNYIASIYSASANYFCTEVEWQSAVNTYGVCGKFVYDSVNNTVRLPKFGNQIFTNEPTDANVELNTDILNNSPTTGTPFIKAVQNDGTVYDGSTVNIYTGGDATGAIKYNGNGYKSIVIDPNNTWFVDLPENITTVDGYYYIVVATATKTDIEVDIDEIASDLNGKADVDLSNIAPTQTAKNTILGWGTPNFSSGVSITLPYTVTKKGFVYAGVDGIDEARYVYVNSKPVHGHCGYSGGKLVYSGSIFCVDVGDVVTCDRTWGNYYFYPMKGTN